MKHIAILPVSPQEAFDIFMKGLRKIVRKSVPKRYTGWVYLWVKKGGRSLFLVNDALELHTPATRRYYAGAYNDYAIGRFWYEYTSETEWFLKDVEFLTECPAIYEQASATYFFKIIKAPTRWRYGWLDDERI